MIEFGKYLAEHYNVKIINVEIRLNEGFCYIFQLNENQQHIMNGLEKYQIEQFIFNAKMYIVEKNRIPLAQIGGVCEYSNGLLKLSGSKEFIELMLKLLFSFSE